MLAHLTALLGCQLVGEVLARLLAIPVPGAVIGMMILFLVLAWRGAVPPSFRETADGLLRHLSLLFVPAGVGIVAHLGLIAEEWKAIGAALVASTLLAIAASALVMRWLVRGARAVSAPDSGLAGLWVYLAASPLAALTATLVAYQIGDWIYRRFDRNPLLNPVLLAVILLGTLLLAGGIDYARYFEGAQFVHFLLGPATVALAVPLYAHFAEVRRSARALTVSLLAGSLTASVSAVGIAWALGASERTLASLAPKSVTTAIAMGISEQIGGLPSLTAVVVILTGIVGATLGTGTLNLLRIRDWQVRGFAVGVAAHGIGTARALQVNEVAGAFAGLAMGLNALATALLVPILYRLIVA